MIAQALGHAACRRGYTVVFTKTSRLLADLAGGHADRSFENRLARWSRPQVLIFDDFAMRDFTLAQADDLYELITARMTQVLDLHRQPSGLGLVLAVPQPGRRRVDPRPHRELGPPRAHGRQVLPAQQAAGADPEGSRQSEPGGDLCGTGLRQPGGAATGTGRASAHLLLAGVPTDLGQTSTRGRARPGRLRGP